MRTLSRPRPRVHTARRASVAGVVLLLICGASEALCPIPLECGQTVATRDDCNRFAIRANAGDVLLIRTLGVRRVRLSGPGSELDALALGVEHQVYSSGEFHLQALRSGPASGTVTLQSCENRTFTPFILDGPGELPHGRSGETTTFTVIPSGGIPPYTIAALTDDQKTMVDVDPRTSQVSLTPPYLKWEHQELPAVGVRYIGRDSAGHVAGFHSVQFIYSPHRFSRMVRTVLLGVLLALATLSMFVVLYWRRERRIFQTGDGGAGGTGSDSVPPIRVRDSTIDLVSRELVSHGRIPVRTKLPSQMALFGLIVMAFGFLMMMKATESIGRSIRSEARFLLIAAGFLILGGLVVTVKNFRESARRARRVHTVTNEPWLEDHPWNRERATYSALPEGFRTIGIGLLIGGFLVPFNLWIMANPPLLVVLLVLLFDFFTLMALSHGIYMIGRGFKHGTSVLWFGRFPFFLGETLEVQFRSSRRIMAEELTVTLRCVQEGFRVRSRRAPRWIVRNQVYAETKSVRCAPSRDRGTAFDLSFELPQGPSTALDDVPATYWELQVSGKHPESKFDATFLLPVYSR